MDRTQRLASVLWPSFVVAGVATGVFFTVFDPMDMHLFGHQLSIGRMAAYSIGFFAFWLLAALSSSLTCFFQRSATQINRPRLQTGTVTGGGGRSEESGGGC